MKEDLDNYFLGELSDTEKSNLLDKIESDETCKSEFIGVQNTVAISRLYIQKGDKEWADRMKKQLNQRIKKKYIIRIVLNTVKYAAVVALILFNLWFIFGNQNKKDEDTLYTEVEVPKGQRVSMKLMDGTEVWLSPRSVIKIPNQFNKEERLIELDGEGYFSVTSNEEKPFIVRTATHDIKVLGTRFNVFAYSLSNRFEIDVLEGSIQIKDREHKTGQAAILRSGERVILSLDKGFIKYVSSFNNEEYLKNGIFTFNNKTFAEILEYLSLWYNIQFDVEDAIDIEHVISGKFRQSDEVRNILKAFQDVHSFKYKIIDEENIKIY